MEYSFDEEGYPPRLSVAARQKKASLWIARQKRKDPQLSPVIIAQRSKIATSFWGRAWCRHIETYQELDYRLERGRSYVRSGAVVDLRGEGVKVRAKVMGNELYEVHISFAPLGPERSREFIAQSAGQIDSLLSVLSGKIPDAITQRMLDPVEGLFPSPGDISFSCTCLDNAELCKHTAAVLYGIGVRFDQAPELFFALRGLKPEDLIVHLSKGVVGGAAALPPPDATDLFGIEFD